MFYKLTVSFVLSVELLICTLSLAVGLIYGGKCSLFSSEIEN